MPKELPLPPTTAAMDFDKYLQIMRRIDRYVKEKLLKVASIFQQFDKSGDGCLSNLEFRKGVEALLVKANFTITTLEIQGVFDTIDCDKSKGVSYKEFAKKLKESDPVRQASLAKRVGGKERKLDLGQQQQQQQLKVPIPPLEKTTADSKSKFARTIFNDSAGCSRQEEVPTSVSQINSSMGAMAVTFDQVRKYNAYNSMLHTHSALHSRTHRIHQQHLHELSKSSTTHGGHHTRPQTNPTFADDPGPWDGTAHQTGISTRKAFIAKNQANMQGNYAPLSDYCHRPENPQHNVNVEQPFNAVFHRDDCLTLQLRAAKQQAGLLSAEADIEDPHFAALMRKRARLGRGDWIRALPDTSSKWSNQVAKMKTAIDQEDFNEDGRLEGGPCEYTYREPFHRNHGDPKFKTFFRPPKAGVGGKNIDSTMPVLLVKTENELTHAATAKIWARARLVDEAARVYAMQKEQTRMKSSSLRTKGESRKTGSRSGVRGRSSMDRNRRKTSEKRRKEHSSSSRSTQGGIHIRTSTPFNGSRPVSRMHTVALSRPGSKK